MCMSVSFRLDLLHPLFYFSSILDEAGSCWIQYQSWVIGYPIRPICPQSPKGASLGHVSVGRGTGVAKTAFRPWTGVTWPAALSPASEVGNRAADYNQS
jgi:hypothetical protein